MGMYTSVILEDGAELQFKSWQDDCETYHIGDSVNWRVWHDLPGCGKLLDGIYDAVAVGDNSDTQYSVVIRDHRIYFAGKTPVEGFADVAITPWNRGWWSESAWLEKNRVDALRKLEAMKVDIALLEEEIAFLTSLNGLKNEEIAEKREEFYRERVGRVFSDALMAYMAEDGLTRRILGAKPVRER